MARGRRAGEEALGRQGRQGPERGPQRQGGRQRGMGKQGDGPSSGQSARTSRTSGELSEERELGGWGTRAGEGSGWRIFLCSWLAASNPPPPSACLPGDFLGALTGERLGRFAPSHIPCFTTGHAQEEPRRWGWGKGGVHREMLTQAKREQRLVCPRRGPRGLTGAGP